MNSYQNNQMLHEALQSIGRLKQTRLDDLDRIAEIEHKLTLFLNGTHSVEEHKPTEEIHKPQITAIAKGRKLSEEEFENINEEVFRHSPDFRSVWHKGNQYSYTTAQASCVELLYKQYENKTPEISADYILSHIGYASQRLSDLFKKHPSWGKLIISGNTRGTYLLNISD